MRQLLLKDIPQLHVSTPENEVWKFKTTSFICNFVLKFMFFFNFNRKTWIFVTIPVRTRVSVMFKLAKLRNRTDTLLILLRKTEPTAHASSVKETQMNRLGLSLILRRFIGSSWHRVHQRSLCIEFLMTNTLRKFNYNWRLKKLKLRNSIIMV
jgi:hypothetical protein